MAIQAQMYSDNHGLCYGNNFGLDEASYNIQQKHQQQLLQQHKLHQQVQQMQAVSSVKNNSGHDPSNLESIIEKNRQEIIQYYNLQSENLKLMIQEQRKREISMLMQKVEIKTMALLKQKDGEIVKATHRVAELQTFIRKLEIENQAWQRVASDKEAVIMNLNTTIEQMQEKDIIYEYNLNNNGVEEVESCCVQNIDNEEAKNENNGTSECILLCKSCNSCDSCVLFLPCRHLCSCQSCEPFLNLCPVCNIPKSCSIEVLMS